MKNMNRRSALKMVAAATAALSPSSLSEGAPQVKRSDRRPNVLFLMVDQQRFDTIAALGNRTIYTPNLDRLVNRGLAFTNAYSPCPVCVPSRYSIRTGCQPPTTALFENEPPHPAPNQAPTMTGRCGPYLAQTMKDLGYRTFGIGKFHTMPWDEELGYDVHLHSEELYATPDQRKRDSYASWIATRHPGVQFYRATDGRTHGDVLHAADEPHACRHHRRRLGRRLKPSTSSAGGTASRTSASCRSSVRIRRSRRPFLSIACMIRTACRIPWSAICRPTSWTSRSRS